MSKSPSTASPAVRSAGTWADMSQHWLWPKLLKAIPMALSPGRLVLAFLMLMVFLGLDQIWIAIWGAGTVIGAQGGPFNYLITFISGNFNAIIQNIVWWPPTGVNSGAAAQAFSNLFVEGEWRAVETAATWWLVFFLPVALAVLSIVGGAISRSAATEFAADVRIGMGRSIAFAMSRWVSLIAAFVAPLIVIWIIGLIMAGLGWLMYHASIPAFFFSIFYFVYLLMGLAIVLIALAYFVGVAMIAPAIAVEGTDAYDAVQRAYAYVFSKPFKLIWYAFVILLAGAIALSIVFMAVGFLLNVVQFTTNALRPPGASNVWWRNAANWTINMWNRVPLDLARAFVISYFFCAGTILYLLMRKAADGQEIDEIWMPGMVPGTAAASAASPAKGE